MLARDEHLDDPASPAAKKPASRPRGRVDTGARRKPAAPAIIADVPDSVELPSLAELGQINIISKPQGKHAIQHGRRQGSKPPPLSAAESRSKAMSAMEAAMPSLDEESARLASSTP